MTKRDPLEDGRQQATAFADKYPTNRRIVSEEAFMAGWTARAARERELDYRCDVCGDILKQGPRDETTIHFKTCPHAALSETQPQEPK